MRGGRKKGQGEGRREERRWGKARWEGQEEEEKGQIKNQKPTLHIGMETVSLPLVHSHL